MNQYELTIILPGTLPEVKQTVQIEKIKKLISEAGGSITNTDKWGKRILAYPINRNTEGVYYLLNISLEPDKAEPVNRVIGNDDQVLRHLFIKTEELAVETKKEETKDMGVEKKAKKVTKKNKSQMVVK